MIDSSFSQISLTTILQILVAALLKSERYPLTFLAFSLKKSPLKIKKYWTHHERKYVYDVSNFFICDFWRNVFYKAHIKLYKSQKAL